MNPNWSVSFTPSAEKEFRKLPEGEQRRLRAALTKMLGDLRNADIRKLKGKRPPRWRLRVGDLRVIFAPDEAAQAIVVHEVFHRQAGY